MRAFVVRDRGAGLGGCWETVEDPEAVPGFAVVEARAVALAWSDVLQMENAYAGPVPDPPFVSGHEFAGRVVAAGDGVDLAPGDRVFGFLPGPGAFAEYILAPARSLRRTPASLDDRNAAAFTTSYVTAAVAMLDVGRLGATDSLLVHAAAGGVGRSAVQLAAALGVEVVVATAGSPERQATVATFGVTAVAGYDTFPEVVRDCTAGRGVDVALESVGGDVFDRTVGVVAPLGRLVTVGASSGLPPKRLKLPVLWHGSISVAGLHIGRLLDERPDLLAPAWDRLLALLADGLIKPDVGLVVDATRIAEGIEALRNRTVVGRVVVDLTAELSA